MNSNRLPVWPIIVQSNPCPIDERGLSFQPLSDVTSWGGSRLSELSFVALVSLHFSCANLLLILFCGVRSARTELYYLHFSLLISAISYGTTSTRVVTGFCEYLDISCFTIPYPGRNVTTIDMGGRQRSATGEWERGNSLSRGRRKASVST